MSTLNGDNMLPNTQKIQYTISCVNNAENINLPPVGNSTVEITKPIAKVTGL